MNKDFKVGDTVKIVGHPYIKDGTLATVLINGMWFDDDLFKVEFVNDNKNFWINIKYLEKVEEWLSFKIPSINGDPLISAIDKLDREVELYNSMYQWKKEFDPEEPDWENIEKGKWYITISFGDWKTNSNFGLKQNLQVYFTTKEKAEQCLEWLNKQGVLY